MHIKNLDCFFSMARQHVVCQDYTIHGHSPYPYLILCDGCSSSQNTDVGARILAISARKFLKEWYTDRPDAPLPSYQEAGKTSIHLAQRIVGELGLDVSCLDSTLLLAFSHKDTVHVYVYGDGYVVAVNSSGELCYTGISYHQNMPYYLNYWTSEQRNSRYLRLNDGGKKVLTLDQHTGTQQQEQVVDHDSLLIFPFPAKDYSLIALMSDGVESFTSLAENRRIPAKEVIKQLLAYKTIKGGFVQRRAKRILKNYAKHDIYPTDDLSVATILLGD